MEHNLRCDIPYTTECEHKFVLHVKRIGLICKICIESTNKCLNSNLSCCEYRVDLFKPNIQTFKIIDIDFKRHRNYTFKS